MPGLYILPDMRSMSIPGQVPKLTAMVPTDVLRMDVGEDLQIGAVRREADVLKGLSLDSSQENFIRGLLSAAMGAENEITLRQDLMSGMIEKKINAGVRRTVLSRAVELFRETRVKPRLKLVMRKGEQDASSESDDGVNGELAEMLEEAGPSGVFLQDLSPLIARYGQPCVIRCLKRLDAQLRGDVLVHPDHAEHFVLKAEAETEPKKRSPRWGGGQGDDDRYEPVGTRKVWGKRIVEKKEDGKWHVVGIVPGLEDPKKVEEWDVGQLSREALQHLIRELAARREEPTEKAKRGKSTPAPPSHRVRGSKINKPRSAESGASGADIELTEQIVTGLKNKVTEHNSKNDRSKHVTLGALKSVWRRGAGAYSVSHRPGMTRQQWAMGRVNAFLELVRTGKPRDKDYVTDNDLLPRSMRKSDSAVAKLYVFDFDSTLFRSPEGDSAGWWMSPRSLSAPCVPTNPGAEWWNTSVLAAARRALAENSARTVLVTGRSDRVFRDRILEILSSADLDFDEVILNPGKSVPAFKASVVKKLLERHPTIKQVKVWDDSSENHVAIEEVVEGRGLGYEGIKVKKPAPVDCADVKDSN